MIRHELPPSLQSEPLQSYLRRAWPLLPGHVLREIIKARDIRIDGVRMQRDAVVRGGNLLEIYADSRYFEPEPQLLYNDGHLLVAVKPQGLPALPDRDGIGADTMLQRLLRVNPSAKLCHRLDAQTGGVMLAAADDECYEQAFEAFKQHQMRKSYRAILSGKPPRDEMTLRAHLIKDARRASVRVLDKPASGSKEIITRARVLEALGHGLYAAELEPVTGRTHQLRAHMAHIHCPILGDDKYGDRARNREAGFLTKLCLWCETMYVPEACALKDYRGMRFTAPAPDWMEKG